MSTSYADGASSFSEPPRKPHGPTRGTDPASKTAAIAKLRQVQVSHECGLDGLDDSRVGDGLPHDDLHAHVILTAGTDESIGGRSVS
jgi:hypothetical protein